MDGCGSLRAHTHAREGTFHRILHLGQTAGRLWNLHVNTWELRANFNSQSHHCRSAAAPRLSDSQRGDCRRAAVALTRPALSAPLYSLSRRIPSSCVAVMREGSQTRMHDPSAVLRTRYMRAALCCRVLVGALRASSRLCWRARYMRVAQCCRVLVGVLCLC